MPQWTMVSTWHGVRLRRTVAANPKRQTIKMYSHRTHGPQKCLWYSHGRGLECGQKSYEQESRYGRWSSPDLHREVGRLVNLGRLIYLYSPYSQNRKSLSGLYSQIKGKVIWKTSKKYNQSVNFDPECLGWKKKKNCSMVANFMLLKTNGLKCSKRLIWFSRICIRKDKANIFKFNLSISFNLLIISMVVAFNLRMSNCFFF